MGRRIVFMGAGAVGGYVGGYIAKAGEDVTLIDPWPEHIEYIKKNGIKLSGTQGEHTVRVKALHQVLRYRMDDDDDQAISGARRFRGIASEQHQ